MPGFHYWPEAPADVSYLAYRHRHDFHVRAEYEVEHDDRDLEFHQQPANPRQALLLGNASRHGVEFGARSCEAIAEFIRERLAESGFPLPVAIEVWEDGEHGARIQWRE